MKTIIDKRFDQLEPGDVLAFATRKQVVQLVELNEPGACRTVRCVVLGQVPVQLREWTEGSGTIFRVEIEQQPGMLTPAQQHADELLSLVRFAKAASFCTPKFREAIDMVLDKVDPPQPPTLDEALRALADVIANSDMSEGASIVKLDAAQAVLDRARRSGVLS